MLPPSLSRSSRSRSGKETPSQTQSLPGSRSRRDMAGPLWPLLRSSGGRGRCRSRRRLCRSGTCRPRSLWGWPSPSGNNVLPGRPCQLNCTAKRRGVGWCSSDSRGVARMMSPKLARLASNYVRACTNCARTDRASILMAAPHFSIQTDKNSAWNSIRTRWNWRLLPDSSSLPCTSRWRCRCPSRGSRSQACNLGSRPRFPAGTTSWQFPAGMVLGHPTLIYV